MSNCTLHISTYHHCDAWYIGLKKNGENWTWVNGKLLNMSKLARKPKLSRVVAYISKRYINGRQFICDVHDCKNMAYICEIPKGKRNQPFIFNIESNKRLIDRNANVTYEFTFGTLTTAIIASGTHGPSDNQDKIFTWANISRSSRLRLFLFFSNVCLLVFCLFFKGGANL